MAIQKIDPKKLNYWERNPRKISDDKMEDLKKSIQEDPAFMEKKMILVNKVDDQLIVYAGDQRLRAVLELWRDEVTIDVEENIDEKLMTSRAYKDNIQYWTRDLEMLAEEFTAEEIWELWLPEWEFDMEIFEEEEQDFSWKNKQVDPDELHEDHNTVTCPKCNMEFDPSLTS